MRIGRYRVKPRFIIFVLILGILFGIFINETRPESFVTSNYWKARESHDVMSEE